MHPSPRNGIDVNGFTLIELMIGLVVLAVLISIAMPSYLNYVNKSRARNASADLMALATNMENSFQRTLSYPVVNAGTTTDTRAQTMAWAPTEPDYFDYTLISTASTYTATATGSGPLADCVLTLNHANDRTVTPDCGFASW